MLKTRLAGALALTTLAMPLAFTAPAASAAPVEISFARFFGACEGDYGTSTDVPAARGECGIITTLINKFNADNKGEIVVKPQIMEWNTYYDQLTARIVGHDVPTVAVMHMAQLGDYVNRKVVLPLNDLFKEAGIDAGDFTDAATNGVTVNGKIYALPWDTHSWLWHYNVGLMKKAGLTDADGNPVVPKSLDELKAQAKKFKEATGKPLIAISTTQDVAGPARNFYTLLYQQGGTVFPDGPDGDANFSSPEAKKALQVWADLYKDGDLTPALDYEGATAGFINGNAGVYICGTWLIDSYMEAAAKKDTGLSDGYYVTAFPTLLGKPAIWADGHSWVLLKGGLNDDNKAATLKFLKYLYDNNLQWARTGHLSIRKSVIDSAAFQDLPFRKNIKIISEVARTLPAGTPRQFGIQQIVGEEFDNVMLTGKSVDDALADMQGRVNELVSAAR
ncbi:ABC transporter substrate-binding protein [Radicibacter daui]|uniref:ABC transporter substrate-binding protein n=1 Tax=Radicibacter daui TaxID=3064829 RepID=UPI004046AF3F